MYIIYNENMQQQFNITELIESNPITKLSSSYNSKMLNKIKENFTGFEQQLFVSSFYCYLNYDKNTDFVVDLDDVWKWLGFSTKQKAEMLLERNFSIDVDYKTAYQFGTAVSEQENPLNLIVKQDSNSKPVKQNGGQNIKKIFLTVRCFKSLCLKAQTKKAGEVHEYYMKMEETMHEVVEEETDELRKQLEQIKQSSEEEKQSLEKKSQTLDKEHQQLKKTTGRAIEQATIVQFPLNTECIYFGTIDNTNDRAEKLIKFGHTNDLMTRVTDHRKKYDNFVLIAAFRVQNKVEIENLIKTCPKIKRQIRSIEVGGRVKTEIIAHDEAGFTIDKLSKCIKDIIHSKTYSVDNFNRIMKHNEELEEELRQSREETRGVNAQLLKITLERNELKEINGKQQATLDVVAAEHVSIYQNALLPEDEMTSKFSEFIATMCVVHPEVEESSSNMEGQFRIWLGTKPKKEVFHGLKNYLDTRFKHARLGRQDEDHVVHGYIGVKLKPIEYKKRMVDDVAETFLFQVCKFTPSGKMLNSALLVEYEKWKQQLGYQCSKNEMKELKAYLNSCEYVNKAVVWTGEGSNEGYYGVSLKNQPEDKQKSVSSTGKKVEKVLIATGMVVGTWDTIAKAATNEDMSPAKMSRSVKGGVVFNGEYMYRV